MSDVTSSTLYVLEQNEYGLTETHSNSNFVFFFYLNNKHREDIWNHYIIFDRVKSVNMIPTPSPHDLPIYQYCTTGEHSNNYTTNGVRITLIDVEQNVKKKNIKEVIW